MAKKTQCERLLTYIKERGSITSLSAFMLMQITQLARCISDLENQGHVFNKTWITLNSGTRVKQYSLKNGA